MKETVLTVKDFQKIYGEFTAVDRITFEVSRGEIFGLLGPNGAGKTSTLECLEGIRKPDGGKLDILGVNPAHEAHKLRKVIGVQLQTSGLPANMQVAEAMRFFSAYHGTPPRYDLLERLGLQEKLHSQYRELSVGQQRRLALALAIAHKPPVVLFDEPTAGLDVGSRTELHALMEELREGGTTIILATHDMAEAEKMTDRVAILLKGKIVAEGSPRELTSAGEAFTKVSVRTEQSILFRNGVVFPAVSQQALSDDYAVYYSTDPGQTVAAILAYVSTRDDRLFDLRVERPTLEERFLEITKVGGSNDSL